MSTPTSTPARLPGRTLHPRRRRPTFRASDRVPGRWRRAAPYWAPRRHGPGDCGEVPEWSNGAVSKTVVRFAYRGFESHPLRQDRCSSCGGFASISLTLQRNSHPAIWQFLAWTGEMRHAREATGSCSQAAQHPNPRDRGCRNRCGTPAPTLNKPVQSIAYGSDQRRSGALCDRPGDGRLQAAGRPANPEFTPGHTLPAAEGFKRTVNPTWDRWILPPHIGIQYNATSSTSKPPS